jgi:DNA-binding MarR family transcriptional regulator
MNEVRSGDEQLLVAGWRELSRAFALTSCRLDKVLHDRHGLGMSEFEILDRLAEATCESVRMHDLGEAVHLSQSALSRAVARLEKEGLVTRGLCDDDRRAVFVCFTDAGRARWAEAAPTHRAVLAEALTPEMHELTRL